MSLSGLESGDQNELGWEEPFVVNQDSSSSYVQSSSEEEREETVPTLQGSTLKTHKSRSGSRVTSTSTAPSPAATTTSRKRKAKGSTLGRSSLKRLKGSLNSSYLMLLNNNIHDASANADTTRQDALPASQMGSMFWSSSEKELFFTALSRFGKDNSPSIAAMVGTKTVPEVLEYLRLLRTGLIEKTRNEARQELMSFIDFPAALQISRECCEALEQTSDSLSLQFEQEEEQAEKSKWGELWLLTPSICDRIEQRHTDESGDNIKQELLSAVDLLKLPNWLQLSSRVFMNPAAPFEDENWKGLAESGEDPAIRTTAFTDFQNLTISITKRLIAASIVCAESRIRMLGNRYSLQALIRSIDVEAAAKSMGLEINSRKFWRDCPRRCHLNVYRKDAAKGKLSLTYEQVEEYLNNDTNAFPPIGESSSKKNSHLEQSSARSLGESSDDDANSLTSINTGSDDVAEGLGILEYPVRNLVSEYLEADRLEFDETTEASDSDDLSSRSGQERDRKKAKDKVLLEGAHHKYAQAVDIRASLREEQNLWKMLRQKAPFSFDPEDVKLPSRPMQIRKKSPELEDWRINLVYRSPWEVLPNSGSSSRKTMKMKG